MVVPIAPSMMTMRSLRIPTRGCSDLVVDLRRSPGTVPRSCSAYSSSENKRRRIGDVRAPVCRKEVQKLKGARQIKLRAPSGRPGAVDGLFAVAAVRAAPRAAVAALVGTARVAAGAFGRELGCLGHGAKGEDGNNGKNSQNSLHFKSPSERLATMKHSALDKLRPRSHSETGRLEMSKYGKL